MSDRPNTPVPDELAATRAEIKRLQAREEVLRTLLINNPDLRTGASWLAEIKVAQQTRTDLKEMRAMHKDIVEQFTFAQDVSRIELSHIDADTGEIVSARKMKAGATP